MAYCFAPKIRCSEETTLRHFWWYNAHNWKHSLYFYIRILCSAHNWQKIRIPSKESFCRERKACSCRPIFVNAKWCRHKIFILSSFVDTAIYVTTQFPYGNLLKTSQFLLKSHKRPNWVLGQFHNCKLYNIVNCNISQLYNIGLTHLPTPGSLR